MGYQLSSMCNDLNIDTAIYFTTAFYIGVPAGVYQRLNGTGKISEAAGTGVLQVYQPVSTRTVHPGVIV